MLFDSSGKRIDFIGVMGRRVLRGEADFVKFAPGQALRIDSFDITKYFDLPKTRQRITLKYQSFPSAGRGLELIESNCLEIDYVPRR